MDRFVGGWFGAIAGAATKGIINYYTGEKKINSLLVHDVINQFVNDCLVNNYHSVLNSSLLLTGLDPEGIYPIAIFGIWNFFARFGAKAFVAYCTKNAILGGQDFGTKKNYIALLEGELF